MFCNIYRYVIDTYYLPSPLLGRQYFISILKWTHVIIQKLTQASKPRVYKMTMLIPNLDLLKG